METAYVSIKDIAIPSYQDINTKKPNDPSQSVCECGLIKEVHKPTCTPCKWVEYISSTHKAIATTICACGENKKAGSLSCKACEKALNTYLDLRSIKEPGFNRASFIKGLYKYRGIGISGKCSLCDENYIFGGNNPKPVINDFDARCCELCNEVIVNPARWEHIQKHGRAYEDVLFYGGN